LDHATLSPVVQSQTAPKLTDWYFRQCGTKNWYSARVPGCNFTDLMRNNLISDPFYSDEESRLQWIEKTDWEYRVEFNVTKDDLSADEQILTFNGLDTYCDIFLNDKLLGNTCNMFVCYEYPSKKYLTLGKNTLLLMFHSPIKRTLPLMQQRGFVYPAENDKSDEKLSVYSRKAPYHFGWDWGPRYVVSGIWRDVTFRPINRGRIDNVLIKQDHLADQVNLSIQTEISSKNPRQLTLIASVSDNNNTAIKSNISLSAKKTQTVSLSITIKKPQLWWPNGLGDAYLYNLEILLLDEGQIVDSYKQNVGLRTIELVNEADEQGVSFYFKVNGHNVFMKGANYIPSDSFLDRVDTQKYQQIIADTVAANMNMLRVWGGGVYEDDRFYELADKSGILIWQDFMFACSLYPADQAFLDNVTLEAEYNIKRLRNHPCLALWCGNNEIEMGIECWDWPNKFDYSDSIFSELKEDYKRLFKTLLPNLVELHDPSTQYISSSPLSFWENSKDDNKSNSHYWGVWHGELPFSSFKQRVPRFMSEYGFQSFPIHASIAEFVKGDDQHLSSDAMITHQKHPRGNAIIERHMREEFNPPTDFESFIYLSQIIQAQAMHAAFCAHRSAKPFCMGTLYWQFNDCWPATSWSSIDYYGRWKALHYQAKRSFKPIIVLVEDTSKWVIVKVVSDLLISQQCEISIKLINFDGKVMFQQKTFARLDPNVSQEVTILDRDMLISLHPTSEVVFQATCVHKNRAIDIAQHYFVPNKDLKLARPNIKTSLTVEESTLYIELFANTLVRYVFLELLGMKQNFSDNFFDLIPNERKTVSITLNNATALDIDQLESQLSIMSLHDTYTMPNEKEDE